MSKWQKIDPDQIKVGDRVKCVDDSTDCVTTHSGIVTDLEGGDIVVGINGYIHPLTGTWYIAKPKKAKPELSPTEKAWFTMPTISEPYTPPFPPPTRPDEPPVGSFFRVDRTGGKYQRWGNSGGLYYLTLGDLSGNIAEWNDITEPGDTWTLLELREVGK